MLSKRLFKNSQKTLRKLQRRERQLAKQLAKKDSLSAQNILASGTQAYMTLQNKLGDVNTKANSSLRNYVPSIDSVKTMLKWLSKSTSISSNQLLAVTNSSQQVEALQKQLQGAAAIEDFIKQRKTQLQSALANTSLARQLIIFKKEAYYYQAQLNEYRRMLNDPDKILEKALAFARNSASFKEFMRNNSILAQLFPTPAGYGSVQALQGLQTRTAVQQQLTRQLGAGNVNPQQYIQQQVSQAQSQLHTLKEKINKAGGSNSDLDMPDFKPNSQKTKPFWKRMEYGLNIQSQKTNGLLPVTSDIAITAGYKLNDKSVIGVGAGYKMGWGKNISNIKITSEGLSLRSYLDIKCKGSFWISGGYEYNYQQSFSNFDQLKNLNAWQKSGLIGVTKKYKVGKKKGNVQMLWDFLSYSQMPKTQPIKFRIGYVF